MATVHWGPTLRGPTLRGITGVNSYKLSFHLVFCFFYEKAETLKLAKVGHPNFGQSRSIKVGQRRSNFWPKSVWPKSELAKVGQ